MAEDPPLMKRHARVARRAVSQHLAGFSACRKGFGGIYADRPLQRFFRDLMAMRNHLTATRERFAQSFVACEMDLDLPPFDPSTMATLAVHG
jgi:hypothetical protein